MSLVVTVWFLSICLVISLMMLGFFIVRYQRTSVSLELSNRRLGESTTKRVRIENNFNARLVVGQIFYVPTDNSNDGVQFVNDFRGTTQKITNIDFERKKFDSINTLTGKEWINNFQHTKEFIWENSHNTLKHNFI